MKENYTERRSISVFSEQAFGELDARHDSNCANEQNKNLRDFERQQRQSWTASAGNNSNAIFSLFEKETQIICI